MISRRGLRPLLVRTCPPSGRRCVASDHIATHRTCTMADHNLSPDIERHHRILKIAGYAAAAAFCAVSVCANLRYGLSLGKNPIDKATYTVASVAADVFKMAAPLLALSLWDKRFHILAMAGFVLWLGCMSWSMTSAVGFVVSSRGEVIADRVAEAATRHGWEAKVERAETQLATLGKHRPVGVIKAELASAAVAPHIWRRSRQCADLALEESRLTCAPVLGLRKELAAAEAAERLEAQLVAGRAQLATVSVAGSVADPQAGALARLTGADEATIRTYVALLLASLIEVGSALGFTLVSVATTYNPTPPSAEPPPPTQRHVPGLANTPRRRANAQRPATTHDGERRVQTGPGVDAAGDFKARVNRASYRWRVGTNPAQRPPSHALGSTALRNGHKHPAHMDLLQRWVLSRLKVDGTGRIPAREAYTDFCRWARGMGIEPGTETRFGRDFSARIIELGGAKVKRRDRAYYEGASIMAPNVAVPAQLH
jgi:hypothetical protein